MTDAKDPQDLPEPPTLPEVPRRIRLYPGQWIGIPILFLVPVLALFNVFGESRQQVRDGSAELLVEVEYPDRLRSGQRSDIAVRVENHSARAIEGGGVSLDPGYFGRFADLIVMPAALVPYRVELPRLEPGQTSLVRVELAGGRAGRHEGEIAVASDGGEAIRVRLRTFVFP
jgi:hypothetical protein